jgi:hypothetical protein
MSDFNPGNLSVGSSGNQQSRPKAERVFMQVVSFDMPTDGYHHAVGHRVGRPDEEIEVRLTTVKERMKDWPGTNEEKITEQYVSGEFPRDTIAAKAKANTPLISFDEAYKVGTDDKGVTEYRAHWPKTMASSPEAETFTGLATIKLRDATSSGDGGRTPAQAYIEVLKGSVVLNKENIDAALERALSVKDDKNNARDPFAIMRVFHEGKQVAAPRLYPAKDVVKVFNQTLGENQSVRRSVDAPTTIERLMTPSKSYSTLDTEYKDVIRAVVAGIKGDAQPPQFASDDNAVRDMAKNYYYGAAQGALKVELVAAEKIDFGADSRKTYLNDKNRSHLAAYTLRETKGDSVRETPVFTDTVVAFHRYEDGEPFAVFASPVEMYPVTKTRSAMTKFADIPIDTLPMLNLPSLQKTKTAEAEQSAPAPIPAPPKPESTPPARIEEFDSSPSM